MKSPSPAQLHAAGSAKTHRVPSTASDRIIVAITAIVFHIQTRTAGGEQLAEDAPVAVVGLFRRVLPELVARRQSGGVNIQ